MTTLRSWLARWFGWLPILGPRLRERASEAVAEEFTDFMRDTGPQYITSGKGIVDQLVWNTKLEDASRGEFWE